MPAKHYANYPVVPGDTNDFVTVPKGTKGLAVWGPYQHLDPGRYDVTFEIVPLEFEDQDHACCVIDIAADVGKEILLQRSISVRHLVDCQNQITVTFDLLKSSRVEYRVAATGATSFRVGYRRLAYPIELRGQSSRIEQNPLYRENYDRIIVLEAGGVRFSMGQETLIARVNGLVVEVENSEDLQLLDEIFLSNEYNILPIRRSVAIDIGMNIGLASLAFACNPRVETVFAYEPFAAPFKRAIQHFRLNPDCSARVRPMNCGLADREEELEIRSNSGATIGVSIRGATSGNLERIRIRDAAQELGPKIDEASRRELGVVMKIDCEGSEFAIFESLKRASLFEKIDAFMIEWHRWWSADMTQANLIAPLQEAGFIVFDRTNPVNPHAGFLQAVRAAR